MKTVEIEKASNTLAQYARSVNEPLIVTRNGKPLAALVPIEEADLESLSLGTNPEFLALLEQSRLRLRNLGGVPAAKMRERLGLQPMTKSKRRR
jgi:prevent-host-death family protein